MVRNKAILDAKYYKTPFSRNEKFHNTHLNQLHTYLTAYGLKTGFLVYPEPDNGQAIHASYTIEAKSLTVFTIPINRSIAELEAAIKELAGAIR